jgi:hypothetical protein
MHNSFPSKPNMKQYKRFAKFYIAITIGKGNGSFYFEFFNCVPGKLAQNQFSADGGPFF